MNLLKRLKCNFFIKAFILRKLFLDFKTETQHGIAVINMLYKFKKKKLIKNQITIDEVLFNRKKNSLTKI